MLIISFPESSVEININILLSTLPVLILAEFRSGY